MSKKGKKNKHIHSVKGYKIDASTLEEHDDGNTTHYSGSITVHHPDGSKKHFESTGGNDRGINIKDHVLDHIHSHSGGLSDDEHMSAHHGIAGKQFQKSASMKKLEELEKRLKEAKEELEKGTWLGGSQTSGQTGSITQGTGGSGGGPSIASQIGFGKGDEDEKEDKKMIEEKLDEHNEKKHGEPKGEDSAMKTELIKFNDNGQWSLNKADISDPKARQAVAQHYDEAGGVGKTPDNQAVSDRQSGKNINRNTVMMVPHSDTHMRVYHGADTHLMTDAEALAYEKKHFGFHPGQGYPTLTEHARDTGGSYHNTRDPEGRPSGGEQDYFSRLANSSPISHKYKQYDSRTDKWQRYGPGRGQTKKSDCELVKFNDNGQWSLEKAKVNVSPADSAITDDQYDVSGHKGKIHGGDPRKAMRSRELMEDSHGTEFFPQKDPKTGKYNRSVSGGSKKRYGNKKLDPYAEDSKKD